MNKATFENWLNNEIFEDVVYFFAKDAPSQTLKNTLIKEHGQEYFDTILSDYINKNLEEITNINNLLTEVRFWGLDNCLHINENIAKNVSNNLYKLLKKHLAKEFEIKSGIYSRYEVDLPEPTVGRSFTNGFHIASNNKRFF